MLKDNLSKGKIPLISYRWESEEYNTSENKSEIKRHAHTITGIALRLVDSHEKTINGKDVSNYKYCAIVYDPDNTEIKINSDCNIYFNEDGSFYIPYRELKNDYDDITRLVNVMYEKDYIDGVEYGSVSDSIQKRSQNKSDNQYIQLYEGVEYEISWDNGKIIVGKDGRINGDTEEVDFIPEKSSYYDSEIITVAVPHSKEYSISSNEKFGVYSLGAYYTSYAYISTGGKVNFRDNGDINICADYDAIKKAYIAINDGIIDNPWNYNSIEAPNGKNLGLTIEDGKVLARGDKLLDSVVMLSNDMDENASSITISSNVSSADFIKVNGLVDVHYNDTNISQDDEENCDVSFEIIDKWEDGYNGVIKITNLTDAKIDNWKLTFGYDGELVDFWNATLLLREGNKYVVRNCGWNQDIEIGQTIEIGISGKGNWIDKLTYMRVESGNVRNVEDMVVDMHINAEWENGYNGEITISNQGVSTIEDWIMEFDYNAEIVDIWNADIIGHEGNHYIIKNVGYNSNIVPGQNINIGMNVKLQGETVVPVNYNVLSYDIE